MLARLGHALIGISCWIAITGSASCAPISDVPAPLKQAGECMLKVLQSESGVDHARLGISTSDDWAHIFLKYEASEKTRWQQPTRFDALKPADPGHGPYTFQAVLPGLVGPEGFDLHVTDSLIKKWKDQCGVTAIILME